MTTTNLILERRNQYEQEQAEREIAYANFQRERAAWLETLSESDKYYQTIRKGDNWYLPEGWPIVWIGTDSAIVTVPDGRKLYIYNIGLQPDLYLQAGWMSEAELAHFRNGGIPI